MFHFYSLNVALNYTMNPFSGPFFAYFRSIFGIWAAAFQSKITLLWNWINYEISTV